MAHDVVDSCWNCGAATRPVMEPRCAACRSLQPLPPRTNHFDSLGLPTSYALDDAQLDAAFRSRSLAVHPDRFVRAPDRERRVAVERTAALNEALRTLRPLPSRAAYLLACAGLAESTASDQAMLVELMEAREEAEEHPARRTELVKRTRADLARVRTAIADAFAAAERGGNPLDKGALAPVTGMLIRQRFLQRLLDDLEGVRDDAAIHVH